MLSASVGTCRDLNQARQASLNVLEPPHLLLTQASPELQLATAFVHSCSAEHCLSCHRQSSLSQLHLFFARNPFLFPQLNGHPIDYQSPVSLSAGLEQAKKLKAPSLSQRRLLCPARWKSSHLGKSDHAPLGRRLPSSTKAPMRAVRR
jgi:hypothetical protein